MHWQTEIIDGVQVTFCRYETQYGPYSGIEYLGKMNEDGTFTVATHDKVFENVPYMGEFDNYRDSDSFADGQPADCFPYMAHVRHNDENAYILYTEKSSIYIRV